MGVLHAIDDEHLQAMTWFDKAIAIFPHFLEVHFNWAVAYQMELDIGNAIHAYQKAIEIRNPRSPESVGVEADPPQLPKSETVRKSC